MLVSDVVSPRLGCLAGERVAVTVGSRLRTTVESDAIGVVQTDDKTRPGDRNGPVVIGSEARGETTPERRLAAGS